jgi:hypothetical protein
MAVIFIRYTDFKINWSLFTVKRTFLLSLVHMYGGRVPVCGMVVAQHYNYERTTTIHLFLPLKN